MATKEQKRQYILEYALALKDLAESYEQCASRIDDMPELIFESMFEVAVRGNEMHNLIADAIEQTLYEKS